MKRFKDIRGLVVSRMAAEWANTVNAAAAEFSVTPTEVTDLAGIDWAGTSGRPPQVFHGDIDEDSIAASTPVKYPLVVLNIPGLESLDNGAKLFSRVEGLSSLEVRVSLSWRKVSADSQMADYGDLCSEALVACLRDADFFVGSAGVAQWGGEFSLAIGPITEAANHWRQKIVVSLDFEVEG